MIIKSNSEKKEFKNITVLAISFASDLSFGNTTACSNRNVEKEEKGFETDKTKAKNPKTSGMYKRVSIGENANDIA